MRKIHCEEVRKKGFDTLPIEKVKDMVGMYYPTDLVDDDGTVIGECWEVTMLDDGCSLDVKEQATAEIISSLEEIKGLLMKVLKQTKR